MSRRQILVAGCGAMGSIIAALLSRVADVTAYDTNIAHVEAINANGLQVEGVTTALARLKATSRPDTLQDSAFDAVLLLTKSGRTREVVDTLGPLLQGTPLWLTLQNGMGNAEILATLADAKIARGVTLNAGRYLGPGRVRHLIQGPGTWIGPVHATVDECRWLADALTEAGLVTELMADPMGAVWSKFVFNSVMNPIGALLMGVNAARYEVAEVRALVDDMAEEGKAVVMALGGHFAFDPLDSVRKIRAGVLPLSKHGGSMALDIEAGAETEIEELTGFIIREGERLGVPVPVSRTVYRLVKGLERARALR